MRGRWHEGRLGSADHRIVLEVPLADRGAAGAGNLAVVNDLGIGGIVDRADNHILHEDISLDFIYSQVKNLRKKMKIAEAIPEIKAVYGFGYKLITTPEA